MNTARRSLTGIPRSALASLGLGMLGALSGCFNPTPPANVLCAPDGWCPSGQTCDMNRWLCVPNGEIPDAGGWPWWDSGWPPPDSWYPPIPDAGVPATGIAAALAAPWGSPVFISIDNVQVTYVKPAIEDYEPEGFYVQSEGDGPAMFVAVSPSFAGVRLAAGDQVSFRVYEMGELNWNSVAYSIGELVVHGRGSDVSWMVQDVGSVYDLGYIPYDYNAELVSAELIVASEFYDDYPGLTVAAMVDTATSSDRNIQVRMTNALHAQTGLEVGCSFRVDALPFMSLFGVATFPVYDISELRNIACPASRIEAVYSDSPTSVRLVFTRALDPATVRADGSQFAILGLTITAAAHEGRVVTLTTTPQTGGQLYTVISGDVPDSPRDVLGVPIADESYWVFYGAYPRARLRVNELKANIVPACDLLELRVVEGGTLEDVWITTQDQTIHTFGDLQLATNDFIVIHFNGSSTQCNPGRSQSETQSPNQRPRTLYAANYDTAYDIYVPLVGLNSSPHTIAVYDHIDRMVDVALVTGASGFPEGGSQIEAARAAEAGEWRSESGTVPPGGFQGEAFRQHAAAGLDLEQVSVVTGWSALDGKASVQRNNDADSNHKGDWTTAPHTFGLLNPGQSPL